VLSSMTLTAPRTGNSFGTCGNSGNGLAQLGNTGVTTNRLKLFWVMGGRIVAELAGQHWVGLARLMVGCGWGHDCLLCCGLSCFLIKIKTEALPPITSVVLRSG